jgi:hypothetical protein
MEIQRGSVSWVRALAFDTKCDSAALVTDVGKFLNCTMKSKGDRCIVLDISTNKEAGWVRYDIEGGAEGSENHCVVVGRTEDYSTVLGQKFCNAKLPKRRTTILGNAVLGG